MLMLTVVMLIAAPPEPLLLLDFENGAQPPDGVALMEAVVAGARSMQGMDMIDAIKPKELSGRLGDLRTMWRLRSQLKYFVSTYGRPVRDYVTRAKDPFVAQLLQVFYMPEVPVWFMMVLLSLGTLVAVSNGQSASLYVTGPRRTAVEPASLAGSLLTAVVKPKPKTPKVHDIVTVVIKEQSSYSSDANRSADKKVEVDGSIDAWVKFQNHNSLVPVSFEAGKPQIKGELSAGSEAKGKATRKDVVTFRVAARIIDVKPNGTCVLEARKTMQIDEERRCMTITGICRKQDIDAANNTVLSDRIFGLELVAKYSGGVKDSTRKGWLTRLVEILSPF